MSGAGLGYGIGDRLAAIFERDLGATAGPEYGKYYGRYADLVRHIADFEEAFGGESDWKVVYGAASGFYCRYHDMLFESITLGACRFTDGRHKTGRYENLSELAGLFADDAELADGLRQLADEAFRASTDLRMWRDNRIAHTANARRGMPDTSLKTFEKAEMAVGAPIKLIYERRIGEAPDFRETHRGDGPAALAFAMNENRAAINGFADAIRETAELREDDSAVQALAEKVLRRLNRTGAVAPDAYRRAEAFFMTDFMIKKEKGFPSPKVSCR